MLSDRYRFSLAAMLCSVLSFFLGGIVDSYRIHQQVPLTFAQDSVIDIPVVRIDGVRSDRVEGMTLGRVRVVADGRLLILHSSGAFTITGARSVAALQPQNVPAPAGMRYVASKRGKKYYVVGSPAGNKLAPGNRVYFPDEASAQKAGYVR